MDFDKIVSNLIPFKDKPFQSTLTLYEYSKKETSNLKFNEIGYLVKVIRKSLKGTTIIFHSGDNIYSSTPIKGLKLNPIFAENYNTFIKMTISSQDTDKTLILKQYLGEIIAFHLRNQKGNWRINLDRNGVYRATDNDSWKDLGKVSFFEGFNYEPFVFEDGSICVAIEPKNKLLMKMNLRDINYDQIKEKVNGIYDYCNLNCEEKKDPYSSCKSSSPNYLCSKEFLTVSKSMIPSKAMINIDKDEKMNLINYSNLDIVCPRNHVEERLGSVLKKNDKPPIYIVERISNNVLKKYYYPPERLQFGFSYDFLEEKFERVNIMKKLRKNPEEKWTSILNYATFFENITVQENINLELETSFFKNNLKTRDYNQLNSVKFRINKKKSTMPIRNLKKNGPDDIDTRKFDKLKLVFLNFSSVEKKDIFSLSRKFTDPNPRSRSFSTMFRIECIIHKIFKCKNLTQLNRFIDDLLSDRKSLKENERICVIPIFGKNQEINEKYNEKMIVNDLISQGLVNSTDFIKKINSPSVMLNIYLGLYVKLKGNPWILQIDDGNDKKIVGFHRINYKEKTSYVLLIFNNKGEFLGGNTRYIDKQNFEKTFIEDINSEIFNYEEIIFIGLGNQGYMKKFVCSELTQRYKKFSYYEVNQSSHINIFEFNERVKMPASGGVYLKIGKDEYYLQTNYFEKFVPSTLKVKKIINTNGDIISDLQEIYNLTQYDPYYVGSNSRLPLPLQASQKIIGDIRKYNLVDKKITIPWFY